MKVFLATVSLLALAVCLLLPVWYFTGRIQEADLKVGFLLVSIVWFLGATFWARQRDSAKV